MYEPRDIRIFCMIWGASVADFDEICLPSLFQPNNVPWLLNNGFRVHFDLYTLDLDVARISALIQATKTSLGAAAAGLLVNINVYDTTQHQPGHEQLKSTFYECEMRIGIESKMKIVITAADLFYGDGSIRNAVTYGQNPGAVVCGMYLRVDRVAALRRMRALAARTGTPVITNAQLVDIALRTMILALQQSIVDNPTNCSHTSGSSLRRITDDLYTYVLTLPAAVVYSFDSSDRDFFFRYGGGRFASIDHVWPAKLIAEQRWRVLGSSDMFFCAELTPRERADSGHAFPLENNRRFNETYTPATSHSLLNQCFVTTLRAEPTYTDEL